VKFGLLANARFIGFGFLVAFASSFGQTFFISLYSGQIRDAFTLSHGEFGTVYSAATLLSAVIPIWSGKLLDQFDLRTVTLSVTGGLAVGCLIMGKATGVLSLFIAMFMLRQFGQGLMGHIAATSAARYFDRGRGRALSLVTLGHPAGEALLPIAAVALLAVLGWRECWYVVAGLVIIVLVTATFSLLFDHGDRHAAYLVTIADQQRNGGPGISTRQWMRREVLRDPVFFIFMPALLAPPFVITGLLFHQVQVAAEKGWSLSWLASAYLAYAELSVVASLSSGVLIDRYGAIRLMYWFLVPMALSTAVLGAFVDPLATWAYMGFAGMCAGISTTMASALWSEVYGVVHIGAIRALAFSLVVLASAGSPILFGWILDQGHSVAFIAWVSCGYVVVAMVLSAVAARAYAKR